MNVIDDFRGAAENFHKYAKLALEKGDPNAALWARLWYAQVIDLSLSERFAVAIAEIKGHLATETSSAADESRGDTALAADEADPAADASDSNGRVQTFLGIGVREGVEVEVPPRLVSAPTTERGLNWWDETGTVEVIPNGD